ncbi:MAG: dihydrodiol dehydrogenase [Rubrobacteraceae bacterium]|nr:dihydrodiol dehydrogenase [Rubrobacteraceae bacterium]
MVRKVRVRGGARLEVIAPRLGYQILLDPPLLESLTWQTPDTLSKLIEEPYGPRGSH